MSTKKQRKIYNAEFKTEALKLAARIGVAAAAKELGVYDSQIYNWRAATQKKSSTSQREAELQAEVARLKRQLADQTEDLAILKKAATYFAKNQK
jgi:transposase